MDFNSICAGGFCDTLGIWLAAILTILVLSYLVHDSFLFRIASGLLVGTAIGFGSAMIVKTALLPDIQNFVTAVANLVSGIGNQQYNVAAVLIYGLPMLLGISLLFKLAPNVRGTTFSNLGLAYLFGIGAALAIGGALSGALVPYLTQTMISIAPQGDSLGWINSLVIVVGTLGAFLAFRFIQPGTRPWQRVYDLLTRGWGTIGRGFIMVTFGALLASVITARVSSLVGQLYFLLHDVFPLIK